MSATINGFVVRLYLKGDLVREEATVNASQAAKVVSDNAALYKKYDEIRIKPTMFTPDE